MSDFEKGPENTSNPTFNTNIVILKNIFKKGGVVKEQKEVGLGRVLKNMKTGHT